MIPSFINPYLLLFLLLNTWFTAQSQHIRDRPKPQPMHEINEFLDAWHVAAAEANATVFFGGMTEESIYIGTDATERWTKKEYMTYCKPYFDKGTTWNFKPYDRVIHLTPDGRHAWFSELLSTWMGVCRGSGIVRETDEGWKLEQYHLSVTVPNEIIKDFISLVTNFQKNQKK